MSINKRLSDAKEASTIELLHKPGISGIGIGKKIVNGIPTKEDAIMVFVQNKVDPETVNKQTNDLSMIPSSIDGIPTDVFECGEITKMVGLKEKKRPIKPGYSVSHGKVSAGTIGGIFYDKDNDIVILSNFHVLTPDGKAKIGDIIYQPGTVDANSNLEFKGWTRPLDDLPYIGTLKAYNNLTATGTHTHDSAIAKVHPDLVKSGFVDLIYPQLGKPLSGFGTVEVNQNVYKLGRTTGFTTGKILSKSATFKIPYEFGIATFTDCIISTAMSQGGDSGSIGINENMQAFGLLFAGSQKVTLYNPISHVANHYGLKVIQDLNAPTPINNQVNQDNIIKWNDYNWKMITVDGKISILNDRIHIQENANHHAYIETSINNKTRIKCKLNTGTDKGATWGIGVALVFPNGIVKINLRHNGTYGSYYNENMNISIGKVEPNKIYIISFHLENDVWHGIVENEEGIKVEISTIPINVVGGKPHTIRIGKTGDNHGPQDYAPVNSVNAGEIGICKILNVTMF